MEKGHKNKQADIRKKVKGKSKWAKREARMKKIKNEEIEMSELDQKIVNLDSSLITKFMDMPLSSRTQRALQSCGYLTPTEIQRQGIPVALKGEDVLGAAKTGSGKTLAFLIPMVECLWKLKWSSIDGLGALVISPTRELAYQTFEVLCKIGKNHDISAGLIIGGKEVSFEQQRIQKTNIIVCTPGRLLQHMDETPNFDCSNLQMLVLDEADRILDMGFSETMNAIIENLPEERQTLLYSATQTSSVSDLARLSLHDPEYVSVYKDSEASTPQELKQSYVVCELQDKINFLFSFIKNHLKSKILVFLSSCKQVKFTYEAYRRLRPGIPLMALYGKQNQIKRVAIYNDFCKKTSAVLFATDIAARGLDFPAVHWVIQLDCPEDANTYIHRAGRTARYQRGGHSLLILLPSEENEMLKELEKKKVPINEIKANPKKLSNVQKKLEGLCAQDQDIKQWAQKSVVSYVRSVYLQSNKKIFNVDEIPVEKYAASLGLLTAPRIRFLQKAKKKHGRITEGKEKKIKTNQSPSELLSDAKQNLSNVEQDFLVLRKRNVEIPSENEEDSVENTQNENRTDIDNKGNKLKRKITSAKKLLRKNIKVNSKVIFDDYGEPITVNTHNASETDCGALEAESPENGVSPHDTSGIDLKRSSVKLVKRDKLDKQEFRARIKQKHREKRIKNKVKRKRYLDDDEEGGVVTLKSTEDDDLITEMDSDSDNNVSAPSKRSRHDAEDTIDRTEGTTLQDDEDLALKLLTD